MNFEKVKGFVELTYMPESNKTNRSFLAALWAEISVRQKCENGKRKTENGKRKTENGEYQKQQRLFASFAALSR